MLVILAGDSGVYVGNIKDLSCVGIDGRVEVTNARHLRRYCVKPDAQGARGDGSACDLAARGIDTKATSTSMSEVVAGTSVLLGVRRVFPVAEDTAHTFSVPT